MEKPLLTNNERRSVGFCLESIESDLTGAVGSRQLTLLHEEW